MTTLRSIRAIEDDIAAVKETFDSRFFEGAFYGHFSRISLQREWQALQNTVAPLVKELNEAVKRMVAQEEIIAYARIEALKRKKRAA